MANGTPSQSNLYLLDGMYNNDDRLGGSQGTQVRVVLDNIEEYQVLSNHYSAEYGGGGGAIINMITRGGTNDLSGRVYAYFRDDRFNARNAFLAPDRPKPDERTLQAGFAIGGPIIRDRAFISPPSANVASVVSAISGAPINETVGRDVNGDGDNSDRPIRGIDDATRRIESEVDSQGRAVLNGIDLVPHVGRSAPVGSRRDYPKVREVRSQRQAAVLVGHVRGLPWRLLGCASVPRRQRGQSLHR